jgi:hypothetical protein
VIPGAAPLPARAWPTSQGRRAAVGRVFTAQADPSPRVRQAWHRLAPQRERHSRPWTQRCGPPGRWSKCPGFRDSRPGGRAYGGARARVHRQDPRPARRIRGRPRGAPTASARWSGHGVHPMRRSRCDAQMVITWRRRDTSGVLADERIDEHVYTRKVSSRTLAQQHRNYLHRRRARPAHSVCSKEMSPNDAHMQMDQRPDGCSRHDVDRKRSFHDARRKSQNST